MGEACCWQIKINSKKEAENQVNAHWPCSISVSLTTSDPPAFFLLFFFLESAEFFLTHVTPYRLYQCFPKILCFQVKFHPLLLLVASPFRNFGLHRVPSMIFQRTLRWLMVILMILVPSKYVEYSTTIGLRWKLQLRIIDGGFKQRCRWLVKEAAPLRSAWNVQIWKWVWLVCNVFLTFC